MHGPETSIIPLRDEIASRGIGRKNPKQVATKVQLSSLESSENFSPDLFVSPQSALLVVCIESGRIFWPESVVKKGTRERQQGQEEEAAQAEKKAHAALAASVGRIWITKSECLSAGRNMVLRAEPHTGRSLCCHEEHTRHSDFLPPVTFGGWLIP